MDYWKDGWNDGLYLHYMSTMGIMARGGSEVETELTPETMKDHESISAFVDQILESIKEKGNFGIQGIKIGEDILQEWISEEGKKKGRLMFDPGGNECYYRAYPVFISTDIPDLQPAVISSYLSGQRNI